MLRVYSEILCGTKNLAYIGNAEDKFPTYCIPLQIFNLHSSELNFSELNKVEHPFMYLVNIHIASVMYCLYPWTIFYWKDSQFVIYLQNFILYSGHNLLWFYMESFVENIVNVFQFCHFFFSCL